MHTCFRQAVTVLLALSAWAGAVTAAHAQAEAYPSRLVRIVVPLAAGSVTDVLARLLADKLGAAWQQQIIVENRPGIPGITSVAKSAADGYTLLVNSNGHTIAGAVNKDLPFDPAKDFAGVTQLVSAPQTLIVPPDLPAQDGGRVHRTGQAKARPNEFRLAGRGERGVSRRADLQARGEDRPRPCALYKGSPEAITSVIRGDSPELYYLSVNLAVELHTAGKVRVMAVSTPQRSAALPDVPTVAEVGPAELYVRFLVRHDGAGRHAGRGRGQDPKRHRCGFARAGHGRAADQAWACDRRQQARHVRRTHQDRIPCTTPKSCAGPASRLN